MSGGAPTPCQAPETNSTTAIHLAQQTEWAETLQDNKVSAPRETVPFGITMRACVLAWAFLQEGELGTLCGYVFSLANICLLVTMLIHTAIWAAKHQSQFTANGNW